MSFKSRLLIGMNGYEPDIHLIRFASMVVRLKSSQRGNEDQRSYSGAIVDAPRPLPVERDVREPNLEVEDPEIRFVYMLPAQTTAKCVSVPQRYELRAQVQTNFSALAEPVAVGCDLVKGHALHRLSNFAADFDSDLMMVADSLWSRSACGRLAMEAPCSVWLVPPAWAPVLRRVLVPIDFSENSARCLQTAIDLMQHSPQAKCLPLHVYRHQGRFVDDKRDQDIRQALFEKLWDFSAAINTRGVAIEPLMVQSHRVDRTIAQSAQQYGVDLIVMSSRRRSWASRVVRSSTTELAIVQSHASLLVLKSCEKPIGVWQALRERLRESDEVHFS